MKNSDITNNEGKLLWIFVQINGKFTIFIKTLIIHKSNLKNYKKKTFVIRKNNEKHFEIFKSCEGKKENY